ncbi:conserved hypothetical protein [Sporisorium reilianum SRZ2]|uniref:Apple domain-containing protein n=1 Tax=Sporisorium reilianum (strain SRZ2) TaxID=999809 RepID=E6ZJJ1_SPORE|nr:conserved hypothetical protein [Sporisorium reilianum SRZ2]
MLVLRAASSMLWLATLCALLATVSASADLSPHHQHHHHRPHDHHHPHKHDHHHHHHHAHHPSPNTHQHVAKRSFGKPMRIWTPAQGPARRSTSDGRALEPFLEDSFPGWTFQRIYDIPFWDGGDRAACPSVPSTSTDRGTLAPSSHHKRRTGLAAAEPGSKASAFCLKGNAPVDMPDAATCRSGEAKGAQLHKRIIPTFAQIEEIVNNGIEADKEVHMARAQGGLQKRIIPTFGQIEEIVNNGIEAGREVHLARAKAGLPDGPPAPLPLRQRLGGLAGGAPGLGASPPGGLAGGATGLSASSPGGLAGGATGLGASPLGGLAGGAPGLSASPLGGLAAASPGTSPASLPGLSSLTRRDRTSSQFELHMQVLQLVSAAFKTSDELKAITAHHSHLQRRTPNWLLHANPAKPHQLVQRSPLGGMGGAGIAVEIIQALMPVILAGIEEVGKLGTEYLRDKAAADAQKARDEAAHPASPASPASGGQGAASGAAAPAAAPAAAAGGATSGSVPTLIGGDKSVGAAGKTKRDTLDAPGSADQCSGTAELCLEVIESTFPHCRHGEPPVQVDTAAGSKTHHRGAAELVRAMTLHCTLKCTGFSRLVASRTNFEEEAQKCASDPQLFSKIHSVESVLHREHTDEQDGGAPGTSLHKRSQPKCKASYQPTFVDAMRPVASYSNKRFGSVVSDPASFLHWGLVRTPAECLHACDQTAGCVFVNIYQQVFSLEQPSVKLINRSTAAEADDREKEFGKKPEHKKNTFVQGHLTCALYSRCFAECDADHASGGADPVFFERSVGWCKSKACSTGNGGEKM